MDKVKVAVIGCGIRGIDVYAACVELFPEEMEVVALAEPNKERLSNAAARFHVIPENCFLTGELLLQQPQLADAVFICTQDRQHVVQTIAALEKGYHVLVEKPISPDMMECKKMAEAARKYGKHVIVCHVLRYTKFYRKIKEIIESGEIGQLESIQAIENVAYWHYAHSYVRGNWRNSEQASPMILAKSCHDMDIFVWLTGKNCKRVSSFGKLSEFTGEKAPCGATKRCLDGCKVKTICPYDAEKIYLFNERTGLEHGNVLWPVNVLAENPTKESVELALKEGPYGRCVYYCDNNVVDHQVVNLEMEDEITVNFTMSAFTKDCHRQIKVMGTLGEIEGDMEENIVRVSPFIGKMREIVLENQDDNINGHGGGDAEMVKDFISLLRGDGKKGEMSSVEQSVESHYIAMAAEESRVEKGKVVEIKKYR